MQAFQGINLEEALGAYDKSTIEDTFKQVVQLIEKNDIVELKHLDNSSLDGVTQENIKQMTKFIKKLSKNQLIEFNQVLQANFTAFESEFFKFISILGEVVSRVSLTLAEMTKQEEELKLEIKKQEKYLGLEDEEDRSSDQSDMDINSQDSDREEESEEVSFESEGISSISMKGEISKESEAILFPNYSISDYFRIVQALEDGENSSMAMVLLQDIRKTNNEDQSANTRLGRVYMRLKLYKLATNEFRSLRPEMREASVLFDMGICFKQRQIVDKARIYFKHIINSVSQQNPYYSKSLSELGLISFKQYKFFQAIYYFKRNLKIDWENIKSHYHYVISLYQAEMYGEALAFLRKHEAFYKDKIALARPSLGALFIVLEASILREIDRNDPQLPQGKILHYYDVAINLLCKEGYVNSPLEKRDEMNDFKDHNIPSHLFLDRAKTFLMFQMYEDAIKDLRICLSRSPWDEVSALVYLGKIYIKQNKVSELTECILQLADIIRGRECWESDMNFLELINSIKGFRIYQKLQEKCNADLEINLVKKFKYSCDLIRVINNFYVFAAGSFANLHKNLIDQGYSLLEVGQDHLALLSFQKAFRIEKDNEKLLLGLAQCKLKRGQPQEAFAFYHKAYKLNGNNDFTLSAIASLLGEINSTQKKKFYLERLIDRDINVSQQAWYRRQLCLIYFRQEMIDRGRSDFIRSLASVPVDHVAFSIIESLFRNERIDQDDKIFSTLEKVSREGSEIVNQISLLKMYLRLSFHKKMRKIFDFGPSPGIDHKQFCVLFFQYAKTTQQADAILVKYPKIIALGQSFAQESEIIGVGMAQYHEKEENTEKALCYYRTVYYKFGNTDFLKNMNDCYEKINKTICIQHLQRQLKVLEQQLIVEAVQPEMISSNSQIFVMQQLQPLLIADLTSVKINEPTTKNSRIRRLCEIYKKLEKKDDNYLKALELATQLTPINYEYLEQLISLEMEIGKLVEALAHIKKYLINDPSNRISYDFLMKLHALEHPEGIQGNLPAILAQIESKYLGETFCASPIMKVFFYYNFGMYDDSVTTFRSILQKSKQIEKNSKSEEKGKEDKYKNKGSLLKMAGDLKKAKKRFGEKDLLIIMRGLLHDLNKNKRLARECLEEARADTSESYHLWFQNFYKTIRNFSFENQLLLLEYVLNYLRVDSPLPEFNMCCKQLASSALNQIEKDFLSLVLANFPLTPESTTGK